PPALFDALHRSTATDPADRHPDVTSWLADIETALAPPQPPAPEPPAPEARPDPRPAAPRRRWRLAAVVVLAAVLAARAGGLAGAVLGAGAPARAEQAAIAVTGRGEVAVGQQAAFSAVTEQVETWVWTLPTGQHVVGDPSVVMTPTAPGQATLVLRA